MSAPRIVTYGTAVSMEAMEWAQRAAACVAEVLDADEHGLTIGVQGDRAGFEGYDNPVALNAMWRALRVVGNPPGWPRSDKPLYCWPCWVADDHGCTHDPVSSEQPPPLLR